MAENKIPILCFSFLNLCLALFHWECLFMDKNIYISPNTMKIASTSKQSQGEIRRRVNEHRIEGLT